MSNSFAGSLFLSCVMLVLTALSVSAAEIRIPAVNGTAGQTISIPIRVDQIENLAGLKIVVLYDPDIIEYQASQKTKHTASLMHVVNDKKPGRLVIVMAGAKGISGKNMDLIELHFKIREFTTVSEKEIRTALELPEIELMSDQLVPLDYTTKIEPIRINP